MQYNPGTHIKRSGWSTGIGEICYWGSKFLGGRPRFFASALANVFLLGLVLGWTDVSAVMAAESPQGIVVGAGVRRFSFPPPAEMTQADVYTWGASLSPRAVLVLCPGFNGNGEGLVRQPVWQEFASTNHLALCAISFVSSEAEVRAVRGYIQAPRGSGDLLFKAIRLGFGRDLPILIYGFSCGGHFALSVADWRPAQVLGWCAYSATWWEEPQVSAKNFPPGIVACGDEDAANYGTSTTFFAKGRASNLPWAWISLGHTGHVWSKPLDGFVRAYFAALLPTVGGPNDRMGKADRERGDGGGGSWRDVDTKQELSRDQALDQPTLASWLPDRSLGSLWSSLHCP